ncbi:hypothetical protein [Zavarzinia aquatilis]|uniref:Uncharacterized protein n=1 Tax=Zavarzinia aquatilis TaxID=2211142 RepID=A0A317E7R0_9PROT|nr:hypothetical protein [Zavarzinia aquatilis]PWR22681.1 hypothetical protein DKG74_12510 [Zavarzinia aquatilis]
MNDALTGLLRAIVAAAVLFLILTLAAGVLSALAVIIPVLLVLGFIFGRPVLRRRRHHIVIIDHEPDPRFHR